MSRVLSLIHTYAPRVHSTLVIFFFGILLPLGFVFGASTEFTTRALVGGDTTPPTVPTGLVATPIATSQIDLVWGPSTDDYLLSGYHVWRDDILIATTSTTTYSDTGLTASTTYSYYVTAFDSFFNSSASSTPSATTTPNPPPPTPTTTATSTDSRTGTWFRPVADEIISLLIVPGQNSVNISYLTKNHIRSVIKWGRTSSYELGSLAERAFSTKHETNIVGLIPGTLYYFSIEGENKIGRYGVMHTGTFMTLPPVDTFAPGNVRNLKAVQNGDDIILTWDNPTEQDFTKVRVMRSDLFYPSDIADGFVAYEGKGESVTDVGSARDAQKQYYTVFSYDELGNISSGAVVSLYVGDGTVPVKEEVDPTINPISLTLDMIEFSQEENRIFPADKKIRIDGSKQLTISIPYERVPEHLKTILVVMHDSVDRDKTFSFLLRINKEKTAYVSVLAPLGVSGEFPVQVSVFDFTTSQIGYTDGSLLSYIQQLPGREAPTGFFGWLAHSIMTVVGSYLFWFILLLILLAFASRRLMLAKW